MVVSSAFVSALFGSPNEASIIDHLSEWNRRHLGTRLASGQLYDRKTDVLRLVSSYGFKPGLVDQFDEVTLTSSTVCARAARQRVPIFVSDVSVDEDWQPYVSFSNEAGFGGVLSFPILSKSGDLIGVTSCHFDGNRQILKSDLERVRVSCDFAADAIAELRWREHCEMHEIPNHAGR